MMKITHLISSLDPLDGGPPVVVGQLAAGAALQGHQVQVVSRLVENAQPRIDALIGSLNGGDRVRYRYLLASDPLEPVLSDSKIVHVHGVWDPLFRRAAATAHRSRIPYVIAPHGMLDPWSLAQKKWKKKLALLLGWRTMLNRSAFLHLLNTDERQLLAPLGLTCATEVIANGISPEEFQNLPDAGDFLAEHPLLQDKPYILFLGRLHHKKGLDLLADAFAEIARQQGDLQLVIAGRDEGAQSEFISQIERAGLTNRVHLVGPIFGKQKLAALVGCTCFCLPSRQEGFSIAILEALACAKPVVITNACHFPEVAANGIGEVVPLDARAIASALLKILSDRNRANQIGKSARKWVLTQYAWPAISMQLIDSYQRHLNNVR